MFKTQFLKNLVDLKISLGKNSLDEKQELKSLRKQMLFGFLCVSILSNFEPFNLKHLILF